MPCYFSLNQKRCMLSHSCHSLALSLLGRHTHKYVLSHPQTHARTRTHMEYLYTSLYDCFKQQRRSAHSHGTFFLSHPSVSYCSLYLSHPHTHTHTHSVYLSKKRVIYSSFCAQVLFMHFCLLPFFCRNFFWKLFQVCIKTWGRMSSDPTDERMNGWKLPDHD